ncbi:universal stress protein [Thermodesulfobacteriota bacterium]
MIKNILVPVDGSAHSSKAIEFAANLANQNDATIHLIHVVKRTEIPDGIEDYIRAERIKETPDAIYLETIGSQVLSTAESKAKGKGVKYIVKSMIPGDPTEKIIDYAKEYEVDLIAMGSRGLSSVKGLMLGSVSTKVCHGTDRTCVIVKKSLLDGKIILIVDDEPDVLETLDELLSMCNVVKASTFDKAKELLETQDFDIAILDIMGVDGYNLLEIANKKKVIAVMLTENALTPENFVRSYKRGAALYMPKEEMANIQKFLSDIVEAKEKGINLWFRLLERLESYFDKKFGSNWHDEDKAFRGNYPYFF